MLPTLLYGSIPRLGHDEDINTIVTPIAPTVTYIGPITRARARQLNYQVLSFLGNDCNVHEIMMLPKLDTFVLLTNEGPSLEKDEHWSKNKCIQFRQHHILMNIRIITKKRKYLVI